MGDIAAVPRLDHREAGINFRSYICLLEFAETQKPILLSKRRHEAGDRPVLLHQWRLGACRCDLPAAKRKTFNARMRRIGAALIAEDEMIRARHRPLAAARIPEAMRRRENDVGADEYRSAVAAVPIKTADAAPWIFADIHHLAIVVALDAGRLQRLAGDRHIGAHRYGKEQEDGESAEEEELRCPVPAEALKKGGAARAQRESPARARNVSSRIESSCPARSLASSLQSQAITLAGSLAGAREARGSLLT